MTTKIFYSDLQYNLFGDDEWKAMATASLGKNEQSNASERLGILHFNLCQGLSFTGRFQMPVVRVVKCPIPERIVAYYRTTKGLFRDCARHFYTKDTNFERVWQTPYTVLDEVLNTATWILGPDFSVYANLLFPQQLWNIFRNKLIVAWWQYWGVNVIPNVSWVNSDYDCSFDGWPKRSVIAVNSTGVGKNARCKAMWIEGYREMIRRLNPIHILRYGAKQKGEIESISTYYPNDNKIISGYGR